MATAHTQLRFAVDIHQLKEVTRVDQVRVGDLRVDMPDIRPAPRLEQKAPGDKQIDYTGMDITEGGTSIPYWLEDPYIREEFEETLSAAGGKTQMDPGLYLEPEDAKSDPNRRYVQA